MIARISIRDRESCVCDKVAFIDMWSCFTGGCEKRNSDSQPYNQPLFDTFKWPTSLVALADRNGKLTLVYQNELSLATFGPLAATSAIEPLALLFGLEAEVQDGDECSMMEQMLEEVATMGSWQGVSDISSARSHSAYIWSSAYPDMSFDQALA